MNFHFRFPLYIILVAALVSFSACQQKGLKEEMVHLDQAFIPVFYHVHQNDIGSTQKSMLFLEHRWQQFSQQYKESFVGDMDWTNRFTACSNWLEEVEIAINQQDFYSAYIFLDHFRYEMVELRAKKDISYYLDFVWDFESSLNVVTEIATDAELCLLEWNEFAAEVEVLNQAWEQLQQTPYDCMTPPSGKIEKVKITAANKFLGLAMEQFNQIILNNSDRETVAKGAEVLMNNYWEFLSVFGDFDSSLSYYVMEE